MNIDKLLSRTEKFLQNAKLKKPTKCNFIDSLTDEEKRAKIVKFASNSYPIVHERVVVIAKEFIETQKKRKNPVYSNMTLNAFFDRLIRKRPIVFYCSNDKWVDRNGLPG